MKPRITIIALGDPAEGLALRTVLEAMEYDVALERIRNPADVTPALRRGASGSVTVLCAQGGPRGFYMGTNGDEVTTSLLNDGWLPVTEAFSDVTFASDAVLICTASATRESGLIQVMLNAGGHLVAPDGYPDAAVIVPWIGACLLASEGGVAEAVKAANTLVAPHNRFSYG